MPNAFTRKKIMTAIAKEFTAVIRHEALGNVDIWRAQVTYGEKYGGSTETYTYTSESAMTKDLRDRSAARVDFKLKTIDSADFDSEVRAARDEMLKNDPRRLDRVRMPKPPKAPYRLEEHFERIGYSKTEAARMVVHSYEEAKKLNPWFFETNENISTVFKCMIDREAIPSAANFADCMRFLAENNNLIRGAIRKRGEAHVRPYVSPARAIEVDEEERAKNLSFEELREIERRRQAQTRSRRKKTNPEGE